jgi:hypothetical protein
MCPLKYLPVIFDFVVVMPDFRLDDGCSVMVAMCFCVGGLRCQTFQKHNFKGKPIR